MSGGGLTCAACAADLRDYARYCDSCGTPVAAPTSAEYKQVTVLFADVVESMDLASALDPERLREIMTAIFNRSSVIVRRYGGTVDKFTGDGVMALFGAPAALEDHAFRACLAALDIQNDMAKLAFEVGRRDRTPLSLRVGLNSGRVIAGDIDSGPGGYTAVGVQVGMAQRMESAAPPGGVMISESTAHLVSHAALLGEPEKVSIKGYDSPVTAYRLLGTGDPGRRRHDTTLVGRNWELHSLARMLDEAIGGTGGIVRVVGPPGIGKSRIVSELTDTAAHRGAEVFRTYCDAHAGDIPFHAVARLLRAVLGVSGVDPAVARARLRAKLGAAAPDDLILLDDLLGVSDTDTPVPGIEPDARRRRLTAMINTASLARTTPTVYVIEDVHWIDDISESMLTDFVSVIPETPSLVIVTQRPEYNGALSRLPGSETIALAPLDTSEITTMATELLGTDSCVDGLATRVAERAVGNPYFAEEIVRDLAERGIITGRQGAYIAHGDLTDIAVPSTLQSTIAARVDRLGPDAKQTLNAAAAIGSRFSAELVARLVDNPDLPALVNAQLIDQATTPRVLYTFRHPLIRTVAYESQLRSTRAELHRRLATAIQQQYPESVDEKAAMIAEHLQASGDLHSAFSWHMRAGTWSQYRSIVAAKTSWQRARDAADQLPVTDPDRQSMRIAARTLLCGNAWRIGGTVEDVGFNELRELTTAAGDKLSLAIGITGLLAALAFNDRITESARNSTEAAALIESIGDPYLTVGLLAGVLQAKLLAGEAAETLRLAQLVIDLADGDATMGNLIVGSPLALALTYRGLAEALLGRTGFADSLEQGLTVARPVDPTCSAVALMMMQVCVSFGALVPDEHTFRASADVLSLAEQSGDNFALASALCGRGIALVHNEGRDAEAGVDLLSRARTMALAHHFSLTGVRIADVNLAQHKLRIGDLDGAIALTRAVIDASFASGDMFWRGVAADILVDALVRRRGDGDIAEAQLAAERLAAVPVEAGFVMHEIPLLRMRALLAKAAGDDEGYRHYVDTYRDRAKACGFTGHLATAERMTAAL